MLIVASIAEEAASAANVLQQAAIPARVCLGLSDLAQRLSAATNAILVSEEALLPAELPMLRDALAQQPRWSDVPVLILTSRSGDERMTLDALEIFGPAGNVTLLERPLHNLALVHAVRMALRARQRQREARELIEQRESVLASISDAFSSIDHHWCYTYVNDRAAELAGLRKEEMLGRNVWEIFPKAVDGEFYHFAQQAMRERKPVQGESFYEPWGRWLDTRIYPTKDGIVVFSADVTERKEQEILAREHGQKLKESEDLLRLAVEAADIGTFDYYPLTGELRFSARCKELFGLGPEARITYETYFNCILPEDRHIVLEIVRDVAQPGSSGRYDIEYRAVGVDDKKERWLAEKGRAVLDETGRATRFIGTILEITEHKNAEIVLERAKQEAEEANRAKDQFLAMLSHELRTPLTPVLMTIASLRRQTDLSDELRLDLEVVQRNVELEALLIDDLLDLTRIVNGKLELHSDAVDVHTAIDHALSISAADMEAKKLSVTRRFDAQEHHCWADTARLQQVFWNLVKNAVKFTPAGGRIELTTRNDDEHNIIVEVKDSGIGIQADLLPRIFDAFEQGGRSVTSQYGGLGLGLAISKRVIDLHGGFMSAQSAGRDQGTTLSVTLKAMETSLLEGPALFLDTDTKSAQGAAILLVEDHSDTAHVLKRILKNAGYAVAHAKSLARARELAGVAHFDIVISDLGLPDGSGLDLMRFLRAQYGVSGIALSGFGTEDDVSASSAAGFQEHLTKPVDWPQLRLAIDRVVSGRTPKPLTVATAV